VSILPLFLIFCTLTTFCAGQLWFKHAMEYSAKSGFQNACFFKTFAAGIVSMTISFFLTLGLLRQFDLSYLYPFQGLTVIIISLMAAVMLKEKLTLQLTIGAVLITAGVVLVSLS
jgi:uncharacterized membrane protein